MWPLGHAAIGYLLYAIVTRTRFERSPAELPVFAVLLGTQFPDLIDKPLAWQLEVLPTGRTLAHSLLFLVPLLIAVGFLARRYDSTEYGIAFTIGTLSHVLMDVVPTLWGGADPWILLWPLVPVEPYESGPPTILGLLQQSIGEPYFLAEFALAAIALVVWRREGYPGLAPIRGVVDRLTSGVFEPDRPER